MSITIVAAPLTFMQIIAPAIPLLTAVAVDVAAFKFFYRKDENCEAENCTENIDEYQYTSQDGLNKFFSKELKTNIVNKDVLLKTLNEHDAAIVSTENNKIICAYGDLTLIFTKNQELEPYYLGVQYISENALNNFIKEINEEYTANVQEASYNEILENLKNQNYEIDEEEILDDNTIVLTVNLE